MLIVKRTRAFNEGLAEEGAACHIGRKRRLLRKLLGIKLAFAVHKQCADTAIHAGRVASQAAQQTERLLIHAVSIRRQSKQHTFSL